MPPLYRILEVSAFSLLNFLPLMMLALYPFRDSLRFSGRVTGILIGALTLIQLVLGAWAEMVPNSQVGVVSAASTLLYAAFYFFAVKKHPGKLLFLLLMVSNLANLTVICAKCLEGQFFPELAVQSYRWSFALMLLVVEAVLAIPVFLYTKTVLTPAMEREPSGFEWKYLWLIPATFYLIWYGVFYGVVARSALEIALRPKNSVFMLLVNVGAFLIYYVVARLVAEQNKTLELTERNHRLTMQTMQYENLQEKITEARRAKHDVRHHIALMQDYLAHGELDALQNYLREYGERLPDDSLIRFCENVVANAVLLYFAQLAKSSDIDYIVKADLPADIPVSDPDISVLFGNLLENALDACRQEPPGDNRIIVRAGCAGNTLCLTVDNTFSGRLKQTPDGDLLSTKHEGIGLGTASVRSIAGRYHGVCRFEVTDGMFCASVMCRSD